MCSTPGKAVSTPGTGDEKRWVVVRPPNAPTGILLARGNSKHQAPRVGDRVGFFLRVEDFDASFEHMQSRGVEFLGTPRQDPYGKVAVFVDVAGNRWDLLGS
jgi:predicted enzyme related to lactoylglutathione lyase